MSSGDDSLYYNPAIGPGSQPIATDGAELDILQLPDGMETYQAPILPEPEDVSGLEEAKALLAVLLEGMRGYTVDQEPLKIDISELDSDNRVLVDQVLGEGKRTNTL